MATGAMLEAVTQTPGVTFDIKSLLNLESFTGQDKDDWKFPAEAYFLGLGSEPARKELSRVDECPTVLYEDGENQTNTFYQKLTQLEAWKGKEPKNDAVRS